MPRASRTLRHSDMEGFRVGTRTVSHLQISETTRGSHNAAVSKSSRLSDNDRIRSGIVPKVRIISCHLIYKTVMPLVIGG